MTVYTGSPWLDQTKSKGLGGRTTQVVDIVEQTLTYAWLRICIPVRVMPKDGTGQKWKQLETWTGERPEVSFEIYDNLCSLQPFGQLFQWNILSLTFRSFSLFSGSEQFNKWPAYYIASRLTHGRGAWTGGGAGPAILQRVNHWAILWGWIHLTYS